MMKSKDVKRVRCGYSIACWKRDEQKITNPTSKFLLQLYLAVSINMIKHLAYLSYRNNLELSTRLWLKHQNFVRRPFMPHHAASSTSIVSHLWNETLYSVIIKSFLVHQSTCDRSRQHKASFSAGHKFHCTQCVIATSGLLLTCWQ